MEKRHLHLLIHEEIYRLPEKFSITNELKADVKKTETEITNPNQVAEPEPQLVVSPQKSSLEDKKVATPSQKGTKIPTVQIAEESNVLPFAIFHSHANKTEIDLLNKIILACSLRPEQYKIFNDGYNQSIKFEKALVFVPKAKVFYTPIPHKDGEFLCSKPLAILLKDSNEKKKLWNALQSFLKSSN